MNLTGRWIGYYEFGIGYAPPIFGERVKFYLEVSDNQGSLEGVITESDSAWAIPSSSRINGFIADGMVSFVKTYSKKYRYKDDSSGVTSETNQELEVVYNGEYIDKYNCIYGYWEIEQNFEENGEKYVEVLQGTWKVTKQ